MIRIYTILALFLSLTLFAQKESSFKEAQKKTEVKLKLKADDKEKDEAKKKALEKIKQRERQRVNIYTLTDEDIAEIEKKEKEINEKNQQQIDLLEGMLKKYADLPDDTKAERMFMLSEYKWDIAKYRYLRERKEYEQKMDLCMEDEKIKCPEKEPMADYSESIKIYKDILKLLPRYSRMDEVVFYLGYGLQQAGKPTEAVSYFQRIIQKYTESRYVPNAYLALGEFFFENNSFIAAKKNYEKVLENKDSDVYDLAMYKMAWTHYNLGVSQDKESKLKDLDKAVEYFKYSIEQAKQAMSFKDQAKNDLILVLSEYDDAFLQVKNYFYKLGGKDESIKRLNNLNELLLAQGKDEAVVEVTRYIIDDEPNGKRVPEYYAIILESELRLNKGTEDKIYREVIDFFAPDATWILANKDKDYGKEGYEFARKTLQNRAVVVHESGQKCDLKNKKEKCNKKELYLKAGELYREYIDKYPESNEAYEDSFYYAEILFYHKEDWKQAADYYEKVFKNESARDYFADAAFGMILALEKLMKDEIQRLQEGKVNIEESKAAGALVKQDKLEFTSLQRQYLLACDTYIKVVKDDKEKPKVHYGAARLYYEKGHYDEAITRFQEIIKLYKGTQFASLAGNLILDTYNRLRNFREIENWSEILLKNKDFTYNSKEKLVTFVRQSILKQGEEASLTTKYHESAEHFLRLAADSRFKNDMEVAPDALMKAAAAYGFAKDESSANSVLNRLVQLYPKSPLAAESLFNLGNVHSLRAKFKEAADYFAKLEVYPENQIYTADALFNSINLYGAIGDTTNAMRLIDVYLKIYEKSKDPERLKDIEVLKLKRGDIFEFNKDLKKANEAYQTYINLYPEKTDKIIELYIRSGKNLIAEKSVADGEKLFDKALDVFRKKYQKCSMEQDKQDKKKKVEVCNVENSQAKAGSNEEVEFIRSKNLVAEILFNRADKDYQKYIQLSQNIIKTPSYKSGTAVERKMQRDIKEMVKLLPEVRKQFDTVLNYESPIWSVASSYRLGEIPHIFAETLFKAPLPQGLDEDEQFVYREMLDELAIPLNESAIKNYEAVLSFVQQHNWYNEWYRKTAGQIVKFDGKQNLFPAAKYEFTDKTHDSFILKRTSVRETLNPVVEEKKEIKKDVKKDEAKKTEKTK